MDDAFNTLYELYCVASVHIAIHVCLDTEQQPMEYPVVDKSKKTKKKDQKQEKVHSYCTY